jgi:WD40 repeat protein
MVVVLTGCADKQLRVWNMDTSAVVAEWPSHVSVPYCAKWAPRRLLAASACSAVCLWIPSPESVHKYMQPPP